MAACVQNNLQLRLDMAVKGLFENGFEASSMEAELKDGNMEGLKTSAVEHLNWSVLNDTERTLMEEIRDCAGEIMAQ